MCVTDVEPTFCISLPAVA